ncbi:hypothetical protein [Haemophilus sp. oral taxon 851]|nr:hypothetical protein [Haemophilus sp. oral taxon 851]EHO48738.1 hypothetical protein HMPREF9096_00461 [Haemophilus sp. oral taxon 851 str. F0397]
MNEKQLYALYTLVKEFAKKLKVYVIATPGSKQDWQYLGFTPKV